MGDANCFEGGVGPDVTASKVAGGRVDGTDDQDTLDGTVDKTECQRLGVILIPGLDIERQARWRDTARSAFRSFFFCKALPNNVRRATYSKTILP